MGTLPAAPGEKNSSHVRQHVGRIATHYRGDRHGESCRQKAFFARLDASAGNVDGAGGAEPYSESAATRRTARLQEAAGQLTRQASAR